MDEYQIKRLADDVARLTEAERATLAMEVENKDAFARAHPHVMTARKIIEKAFGDPEMWKTHGLPSDDKLAWLEREISAAILEASKPST